MAETGIWAWSRADSRRLAKVLVVVGAFLAGVAVAGLVDPCPVLGRPGSCPNSSWIAVPFGLLGFTLVVAGVWLREEVAEAPPAREG